MPLSPPQIRAAELLAKGHSHQEVGDAVNVSRRTILRWLKLEDFKNLSYGLAGRVSSPQPAQPQRSSQRRRHSGSLTPQDLVEDALVAIQSILIDPESRNCDRLKAASLIGEWAGLGHQKSKMAEAEAIKTLIETGWLPDEVLEALIDGWEVLKSKMKSAFAQSGHQNGDDDDND